MRQVAHPYELRTDQRFTPRRLQALLRRRTRHLPADGRTRLQATDRARRKTGRPPKLSVEDHVLLTLEYWREYRTLFHLATSWVLHESNVCRVIRRVEDILTKSRAFKLPGKKVL